MAFFDSYKNINRGGITKDSKTATADALFAACQNPDCRDPAMQIVKALLDFKALQSNDASAERSLGDLAYYVRRCNQAREEGSGVAELTESSLHELVRNRSAIFKKELPATFKALLQTLLPRQGGGMLIDKNTARILRSNGLITEAQARNAPDSIVAVQILPFEVAAFFNQSEKSWGEDRPLSAGWSLSTFLLVCDKDLSRNGSDMEKKAFAHLVVQASRGSLGTQKFHEVQRQAKEVGGTRDNHANFDNKMRGRLEPNRANEVSPYSSAKTNLGGQEKNFIQFFEQTKGHAEQYRRFPGFMTAMSGIETTRRDGGKSLGQSYVEAMDSLDSRMQSLRNARPRISQHLKADYARQSTQYQIRPTIMTNERPPQSNATHQQWLDMQEAAFASREQKRLVEAEEAAATRALLVCAAASQTIQGMLYNDRKMQNDGTYDLNDDEERLLGRVEACVVQQPGELETREQRAIGILCRGGGSQVKGTTTDVQIQAKIVHQTMVREIHIPGCQPFERFYLVQTRKIQFSWDEKVNFIQGKITEHSPWTVSTTDPKPIEAC
jgi:hypothetical protein